MCGGKTEDQGKCAVFVRKAGTIVLSGQCCFRNRTLSSKTAHNSQSKHNLYAAIHSLKDSIYTMWLLGTVSLYQQPSWEVNIVNIVQVDQSRSISLPIPKQNAMKRGQISTIAHLHNLFQLSTPTIIFACNLTKSD